MIFDTDGDSKYQAVIDAHYRNAAGALVCVDLSQEDCFFEEQLNKIERTIQDIRASAMDHCIVYLVGCKKDLIESSSMRKMKIEEFLYRMNLYYFDQCQPC